MSSATQETLSYQASALLSLSWDGLSNNVVLSISLWVFILFLCFFIVLFVWRVLTGRFTFKHYEIDQAEIGVGTSKFRFRPNRTDRQVAYSIWVELSTRKIGLAIDFDHDVISEIYNSWYEFFSITRELIKTIPATKIKRKSTQAIIKLSVEVLNAGLRPHLTRWQARYRYWYERELRRIDQGEFDEVLEPQQIQIRFPQYEELKVDMNRVNQALIRYREKMHELVLKN